MKAKAKELEERKNTICSPLGIQKSPSSVICVSESLIMPTVLAKFVSSFVKRENARLSNNIFYNSSSELIFKKIYSLGNPVKRDFEMSQVARDYFCANIFSSTARIFMSPTIFFVANGENILVSDGKHSLLFSETHREFLFFRFLSLDICNSDKSIAHRGFCIESPRVLSCTWK